MQKGVNFSNEDIDQQGSAPKNLEKGVRTSNDGPIQEPNIERRKTVQLSKFKFFRRSGGRKNSHISRNSYMSSNISS